MERPSLGPELLVHHIGGMHARVDALVDDTCGETSDRVHGPERPAELGHWCANGLCGHVSRTSLIMHLPMCVKGCRTVQRSKKRLKH